MNEQIEKVTGWIKSNPLVAAGAGLGLILLLPKLLKGTRSRRRRRVRVSYSPVRRRRTLRRAAAPVRRRRSYTKGGKAKKPWQIKGSPAARRYMARLRRMR